MSFNTLFEELESSASNTTLLLILAVFPVI